MVLGISPGRGALMSEIKGKVGNWELTFKSPPRGISGTVQVVAKGQDKSQAMEASWRRDRDGIWIELPYGVFGFDLRGVPGDDGNLRYEVTEREGSGNWSQVVFLRSGEESASAAAAGAKKGVRVRAQMPGKITRVLVAVDAVVEKDQPLFVMEAMKMENEIRAPQAGKVTHVKVSEGQAVETGADLCMLGAMGAADGA